MELCDCFNAHLKGIMPRSIFFVKNFEFRRSFPIQKLLLEQQQEVEPRYTDTRLKRTPLLLTDVLVPGERPYIFSRKIYPLNTNTR